VFDVDGKPVRDRSERLAKLFLTPTSSSAEQAQMIVGESTRYNIGNLQRTVNVPVLPLVFLDPKQRPRFKFTPASNAAPSLAFARVASTAGRSNIRRSKKTRRSGRRTGATCRRGDASGSSRTPAAC